MAAWSPRSTSCWGGGGGTDTDASRPSSAPDVQTLNGMQEFGAQQHFQPREQRQRPQVFRIDTESEAEPRAQPAPRVQARPARPTRFFTGPNPAPLTSGSDSSGPRAQRAQGSRQLPAPSFEALRSASEPEAA